MTEDRPVTDNPHYPRDTTEVGQMTPSDTTDGDVGHVADMMFGVGLARHLFIDHAVDSHSREEAVDTHARLHGVQLMRPVALEAGSEPADPRNISRGAAEAIVRRYLDRLEEPPSDMVGILHHIGMAGARRTITEARLLGLSMVDRNPFDAVGPRVIPPRREVIEEQVRRWRQASGRPVVRCNKCGQLLDLDQWHECPTPTEVVDGDHRTRLLEECYSLLKRVHRYSDWTDEYHDDAAALWTRLGEFLYPDDGPGPEEDHDREP